MYKHPLLLLYFIFLPVGLLLAQAGADKAKADSMFKATLPLFDKMVQANVTDRDSSIYYNKAYIRELEKVYQADTTNAVVGYYMLQCNKMLGNDAEVLRWAKHQLRFQNRADETADYYNAIAGASITLYDWATAKIYLQASLALSESNKGPLDSLMFYHKKSTIALFIGYAKSLNHQPNAPLLSLLQQKNVAPCKYALQIVEFLLPYTNKYYNKEERQEAAAQYAALKKECMGM